jgi:hypothetical protein
MEKESKQTGNEKGRDDKNTKELTWKQKEIIAAWFEAEEEGSEEDFLDNFLKNLAKQKTRQSYGNGGGGGSGGGGGGMNGWVVANAGLEPDWNMKEITAALLTAKEEGAGKITLVKFLEKLEEQKNDADMKPERKGGKNAYATISSMPAPA